METEVKAEVNNKRRGVKREMGAKMVPVVFARGVKHFVEFAFTAD